MHTRPMPEGVKKNLETIGWEDPLKDVKISADSSCHGIESLIACEEFKADAYIPDKDFRKRNPDFSGRDKYRSATDRKKTNHKRKKGLFTIEDFKYDEKRKRMICPAGIAMYIRNRMNIAKALIEEDYGRVKALQWILTHLFCAKALAVKRVTSNKGKNTPGIDSVFTADFQRQNESSS